MPAVRKQQPTKCPHGRKQAHIQYVNRSTTQYVRMIRTYVRKGTEPRTGCGIPVFTVPHMCASTSISNESDVDYRTIIEFDTIPLIKTGAWYSIWTISIFDTLKPKRSFSISVKTPFRISIKNMGMLGQHAPVRGGRGV